MMYDTYTKEQKVVEATLKLIKSDKVTDVAFDSYGRYLAKISDGKDTYNIFLSWSGGLEYLTLRVNGQNLFDCVVRSDDKDKRLMSAIQARLREFNKKRDEEVQIKSRLLDGRIDDILNRF